MRKAFQEQDVEKVLELDETLLELLGELRQQGFTLPVEQRASLKSCTSSSVVHTRTNISDSATSWKACARVVKP